MWSGIDGTMEWTVDYSDRPVKIAVTDNSTGCKRNKSVKNVAWDMTLIDIARIIDVLETLKESLLEDKNVFYEKKAAGGEEA